VKAVEPMAAAALKQKLAADEVIASEAELAPLLEKHHLTIPKVETARALVNQAGAAIAAKDWPRAKALAQPAIAAAPGARGPLLMLARAEDYADHDDSAIAGYRAVLAVATHDAIAHSNLGRLLAKRHDPAAAAEYRAAVEAEPAWTIPAYNLA